MLGATKSRYKIRNVFRCKGTYPSDFVIEEILVHVYIYVVKVPLVEEIWKKR
jgi:hypothetical protein